MEYEAAGAPPGTAGHRRAPKKRKKWFFMVLRIDSTLSEKGAKGAREC